MYELQNLAVCLAPFPLVASGFLFFRRQFVSGFLVGAAMIAVSVYALGWIQGRVFNVYPSPICIDEQDLRCKEAGYIGRLRREDAASRTIPVFAMGDFLIMGAAAFLIWRKGNPPRTEKVLAEAGSFIPGRPPQKQSEKPGAAESFRFRPLPEEKPPGKGPVG